MRRPTSLLTLVLGAALLSAGPLPAAAQSRPDPNEERARELFQNGALLYEEGRYEDAIIAWQEAYRLSERAELLFNIANAQERIGRYQDALDTLSRYRAYAAADEREALDRRIRNLERRLAETATTTPAPAPAPTPAPVVVVQPAPAPAPAPAPTPARSGVRVLPIALYGVGALGLGAGALFGLQASDARQEALALCVDGEGGLLCPDTASDALDRDARASLLADVGFGVGAAGLIGGTLTLLFGGGTAASVDALPGGASLTLSGSF